MKNYTADTIALKKRRTCPTGKPPGRKPQALKPDAERRERIATTVLAALIVNPSSMENHPSRGKWGAVAIAMVLTDELIEALDAHEAHEALKRTAL